MLGLLRLAYLVWSIGAIVVFARGLSQIIFGRPAPGVNRFSRAIFLAVVWPVALITPEGRAALRALGRSQ